MTSCSFFYGNNFHVLKGNSKIYSPRKFCVVQYGTHLCVHFLFVAVSCHHVNQLLPSDVTCHQKMHIMCIECIDFFKLNFQRCHNFTFCGFNLCAALISNKYFVEIMFLGSPLSTRTVKVIVLESFKLYVS